MQALKFPVNVSASALGSFSSCPMKFYYSRLWSYKGEPSLALQVGSEAHQIMEGSLAPAEALPRAAQYAKRLRETEQGLGINIIQREVKQTFMVTPQFRCTRIIDGLGYDRDGAPLVLDYKTTGRKWQLVDKIHKLFPARILGWQTVVYLLPSPDDTQWEGPWPKSVGYLIASPKNMQYFTIPYDDSMVVRLHQVLGQLYGMVESNNFYKNYGYGCDYCGYRDMCLEVPGWEESYEKKGA